MPNMSFPAFMIFLRRFAVLIAAILAVIVYLGVYNATQSTQYATLAVVIVLALWIITLILVMKPLKRQ
jgi:cell division septal protein FtsQ